MGIVAKKKIDLGQSPTGEGGESVREGALKLQTNDDTLFEYLGADKVGLLPYLKISEQIKAVSYTKQEVDNKLNQKLESSGNIATAGKLQTPRQIGGVDFDGSANIDLPGVNQAGNQDTSGNASSATKLQTARKIGGVAFNGTQEINLPGVNQAGNQNTSGNAGSATKLQTARKIGGVAFDGTQDISLPSASTTQKGMVQLVSGLLDGGADKAISAEAIKMLYSMFSVNTNHIKVPRLDDQTFPWTIQWGQVNSVRNVRETRPFNFPFNHEVLLVLGSNRTFGNNAGNSLNTKPYDLNGFEFWFKAVAGDEVNDFSWLAIGY